MHPQKEVTVHSHCEHLIFQTWATREPQRVDSQYVFQMRKMLFMAELFTVINLHTSLSICVISFHNQYFGQPELLMIDKRFITDIQSLSGHWTPQQRCFKHGCTRYWLIRDTVYVCWWAWVIWCYILYRLMIEMCQLGLQPTIFFIID